MRLGDWWWKTQESIGLRKHSRSVNKMDIQGVEPWTSRMRSVRATTVPNAR